MTPRPGTRHRVAKALRIAAAATTIGAAPHTGARPPGPMVYVASDSARLTSAPAHRVWQIARPMVWIPDNLVLDPHSDWRPESLYALRKKGVMNLPAAPLFYNKERGTQSDQVQAVKTLRRLYPDRRIGVFYTAAESVYRENAWRASQPERIEQAQLAWHTARFGRPETDDVPAAPGIEQFCDYTTAYGYRLTPDRGAHLRGVLAGRDLSQSHTPKPIYLVTWTHIPSQARQMGPAAGQRQPLEEWRWEVTEVWPHFAGVIIFAPDGIDEELSDIIIEASRDWAPAWIQGDFAPIAPAGPTSRGD